jgi:hypothetical protein
MPARSIKRVVPPPAQQPDDVAEALRSVRRSQRGGKGRFSGELVLALARNAAKERLADAFAAAGELVPVRDRVSWLAGVRALLERTGARFAVGLWVRQVLLASPPDEQGTRSATYEQVAASVAELAADVLGAHPTAGEHVPRILEALASSAAVQKLWGQAITTHRGAVRVVAVPRLGYAAVVEPSAPSA